MEQAKQKDPENLEIYINELAETVARMMNAKHFNLQPIEEVGE